jgi:UDP-glucose 4-epimerase
LRIVVTGGAGYIGSVAVHRLAARGDQVAVIDNLSQGHEAALPFGVELIRADLRDQDEIARALQEHRPEAVLHFAALTIAPESVRDPASYWRVNACGTINLLDAMRDAGVGIIVLSSTAAVYGSPAVTPIVESAPLAPINPYGASKLAAERAVIAYAEAYGLRGAVLRYFNVAGAVDDIGEDHRPETHLIPNALDAAAGRRDALQVFGSDFPTADGTAVRDYVHVDDLIDAHILALDHLAREAGSLEPLNLGTREGASVLEVLAAVERITGRNVPAIQSPSRPGDPPILVADSSRARAILGWEPRRSSLETMVASAWSWRERFPNGYRSVVPHR